MTNKRETQSTYFLCEQLVEATNFGTERNGRPACRSGVVGGQAAACTKGRLRRRMGRGVEGGGGRECLLSAFDLLPLFNPLC